MSSIVTDSTSQATLVSDGKVAIKKGSKSFALASFFFSAEQKHGAWLLYSWCRHVDDEIDKATSPTEAKEKVLAVRAETKKALESPESSYGPFRSLGLLAQQYDIPHNLPLDLIRGMQMDVDGSRIPDTETLLDYCYCVAGTVGLMMCYIMKVPSKDAHPYALAMGQAMQLTNIARDIKEDLNLKRIYIPQTWLSEIQLNSRNFAESQKQWPPLVQKLLVMAEDSYKEGFKGLSYLPLRAAWAVLIAAFIYRAIGRKVAGNYMLSFEQRTFISLPHKLWLLLLATLALPYYRLKK